MPQSQNSKGDGAASPSKGNDKPSGPSAGHSHAQSHNSRAEAILRLAVDLAYDPGNLETIGRLKGEIAIHEAGRQMMARLSMASMPHADPAPALASASPRKTLEWAPHVTNRNSPCDVDSICETVDAALEFLSVRGILQMDLSGLDFQSVSGEHLAAVLRASAMWRSTVKGWSEALGVAEKALLMDGLDPSDALCGLRDGDDAKRIRQRNNPA